MSRKLHPYPSLSELRDHRNAIDRSQTFGTILSTRLATSPALGLRDMWDLVGDYRHIRKLKKAKRESAGKSDLDAAAGSRASLDDTASVKSVSFSTPDLAEHLQRAEVGPTVDKDDADLKRLGLFLMNEVADFLERIKKSVLRSFVVCGVAAENRIQHLPVAPAHCLGVLWGSKWIADTLLRGPCTHLGRCRCF